MFKAYSMNCGINGGAPRRNSNDSWVPGTQRPKRGDNPGTERGRGIKRTLSAAARKRISQAQKARWAKKRRQKAAKA